MTDHDRMRAMYKRNEHGYSLGQSMDADRDRAWRARFLLSTIAIAVVAHVAAAVIRWLVP